VFGIDNLSDGRLLQQLLSAANTSPEQLLVVAGPGAPTWQLVISFVRHFFAEVMSYRTRVLYFIAVYGRDISVCILSLQDAAHERAASDGRPVFDPGYLESISIEDAARGDKGACLRMGSCYRFHWFMISCVLRGYV